MSVASKPLKALILAGGKGTRLRPLTYTMAKQLVPVANKPILHYALETIYKAGIRDFGIIISPETGEAIRASVAAWQPPDTQVTFIPQAEPKGLAHAVFTAKDYLGDSPFLMYLGDNLINADLRELIDAFHAEACAASILLTPVDNPSSFGVAELDKQGHVKRLVEKPKNPPSNLALIGVYLFTPQVFEAIAQITPSARGELEITDALQKLLDTGHPVRCRIHEGWWLDTGKKDDLLAANRTVLGEWLVHRLQGTVDASSTLEGVIDLGEGTTVTNSQLVGPVRIGQHCHLENAVIGPDVSLADGCTVVGATIKNSVLLEGCRIQMAGVLGNSLLGQHCDLTGNGQSKDAHYTLLLADDSQVAVG